MQSIDRANRKTTLKGVRSRRNMIIFVNYHFSFISCNIFLVFIAGKSCQSAPVNRNVSHAKIDTHGDLVRSRNFDSLTRLNLSVDNFDFGDHSRFASEKLFSLRESSSKIERIGNKSNI